MKITVRIKRQNSFEAEAFYQTILCDCDAETNIATLLREINAEEVLDIDGIPLEKSHGSAAACKRSAAPAP